MKIDQGVSIKIPFPLAIEPPPKRVVTPNIPNAANSLVCISISYELFARKPKPK